MISDVWNMLTSSSSWQGGDGFGVRLFEHLTYVSLALGLAGCLAVPLGCAIGHTRKGAAAVINLGNAARALPTLGLLTLSVLIVGLGLTPVLVVLVVLAVPPLLIATYAGVAGVSEGTVRAARGAGMTELQILRRVELPTAAPLILSGLRSAALQTVATATIAAHVALGGLGRFVMDGFAVRDFAEMLAGAVMVAVLALAVDSMLALSSRFLVSPGLRGGTRRGTARDTWRLIRRAAQ